MKKILPIVLSMIVAFTLLIGCSQEPAEQEQGGASTPEVSQEQGPEQSEGSVTGPTEVKGVTIPEFSVSVNGVALDHDSMASYPIYEISTTTTNSAGTTKTTVYQGFKISDILAAADLTENYVWIEATATDGYAVDFTGDVVTEDTTLLAVTEDGSPFTEGPWFAPGSEDVTSSFAKNISSILVNTTEGAPEGIESGGETAAAGGSTEGAPEILDRTDKVEFAEFEFKVNGSSVTNSTLDGLSIFKITAMPLNKNGEAQPADYTGYKLADVLEAAGAGDFDTVTVVANDGFKSELTHEQASSDHTLLAIEKDKETGEDGTVWIAPTLESEANKYPKLVVEVVAN